MNLLLLEASSLPIFQDENAITTMARATYAAAALIDVLLDPCRKVDFMGSDLEERVGHPAAARR